MTTIEQSEVIFELESQESFVIELPDPLHETCPCLPVLIKFVGANSFDITEDSLLDVTEQLHCLLRAALLNDLRLHHSIDKNIGYLWNEELRGETQLPGITNSEGTLDWVGQRNILWSAGGAIRPKVTVWLYNNKNREITLEITPSYPWHFVDPEPDENYIVYEEFMRNYESLLIRTIPRDLAERWLVQVEHLISNLNEVIEWQERNPQT